MWPFQCLGTNDCADGLSCCFALTGQGAYPIVGGAASSCGIGCATGTYLCQNNGDCGPGCTCQPQAYLPYGSCAPTSPGGVCNPSSTRGTETAEGGLDGALVDAGATLDSTVADAADGASSMDSTVADGTMEDASAADGTVEDASAADAVAEASIDSSTTEDAEVLDSRAPDAPPDGPAGRSDAGLADAAPPDASTCGEQGQPCCRAETCDVSLVCTAEGVCESARSGIER